MLSLLSFSFHTIVIHQWALRNVVMNNSFESRKLFYFQPAVCKISKQRKASYCLFALENSLGTDLRRLTLSFTQSIRLSAFGVCDSRRGTAQFPLKIRSFSRQNRQLSGRVRRQNRGKNQNSWQGHETEFGRLRKHQAAIIMDGWCFNPITINAPSYRSIHAEPKTWSIKTKITVKPWNGRQWRTKRRHSNINIVPMQKFSDERALKLQRTTRLFLNRNLLLVGSSWRWKRVLDLLDRYKVAQGVFLIKARIWCHV